MTTGMDLCVAIVIRYYRDPDFVLRNEDRTLRFDQGANGRRSDKQECDRRT